MTGCEHETLETLIRTSLEQQIKMIHLLKSLREQMAAHSLGIVEQFNTSFHDLQQDTQRTDNKLLIKLKQQDFPDNIEELLAKRNSLQKDVLILFKNITPKASSAKTLMANEIQSIKKGRNALSGYRNQSNHQGKIVNRAT